MKPGKFAGTGSTQQLPAGRLRVAAGDGGKNDAAAAGLARVLTPG